MPAWPVKQPNGRWARFSTIADDFTHWDCRLHEIVHALNEQIYGPWNERDILESLIKRINIKEGDPGSWKDCIDTISSVHGYDEADKWVTRMCAVPMHPQVESYEGTMS